MFLLAAWLPLGPQPAPPSSIEVQIERAGEPAATCQARGVLRARPLWPPPETPPAAVRSGKDPFERAFAAPAKITVPIAGGAWTFSAEAPGCWSASVTMTSQASHNDPIRISLWSAAYVSGTLAPDRATSALTRLDLRVMSVPRKNPEQPSPIPETSFECAVRDRAWRCAIASAAVDLRLSAPGYVPVYFWDLAVPPGETRDLGEVRLERGGSITGRVTAGRASLSDVSVDLEPETLSTGGDRPFDRMKALAQKGSLNQRGFFQLTALKAGGYRLLIQKPGFSTLRVPGIRVREGEELVLGGTLALQALAELRVEIDPPQDPAGRSWRVRLEKPVPLSPFSKTEAEGLASPSGVWSRDKLEAGEYRLSILDEAGSTRHLQVVTVEPGGAPLLLSLGAVAVQGTVKAGKDPIAGLLIFQSEEARVEMRSDASGSFAGSLTREGDWKVGVFPNQPDTRLWTSVKVEKSPGQSWADVAIELPGGRLEGKVVDESGHEVKATVLLDRDGTASAEAIADARGKFLFLGQRAGKVQLRAVTRDLQSEEVTHEISEKRDSPIELVLRRPFVVKGRVVASGQAIPGALVRFRGTTFPDIREATTGLRGEFRLAAAGHPNQFDLVVVAPGFPLKVATVHLVESPSEVILDLAGPSGTLAVRMGGKRRPGWPTMLVGSSSFPLFSLRPVMGWGDSDSHFDASTGTFRFEVQAGTYFMCPPASGANRSPSCRGLAFIPVPKSSTT